MTRAVVKTKKKPAPKAALATQAARFKSARAAHADEIAEDYAEAIAELIEQGGSARVTDLAACLGVSHVTVVRTLARLGQAGLVEVEPYRAVTLTPRGKGVAAKARHRHGVVLEFLLKIGVPQEHAERDAEGIEHHVSAGTLKAMERFIGR